MGATLIETMIAMAVIAGFLTAEYAASGRIWGVLRANLESNAACRCLNGRVEQIRAATWAQLTTTSFLSGTVLAVAPDSAGDMGSLNETINVIAYPTPSPNPTALQVTRNNTTGAVTVVSAGDGTMPSQTSVRIDITASWTPKGATAAISRQVSMIISNGGITGRH
jgi:hypothetical protein